MNLSFSVTINIIDHIEVDVLHIHNNFTTLNDIRFEKFPNYYK